MFLGSFVTAFTGKNRILLPRKFRRELGSENMFYIIVGIDGEIWGLSNKQWQKEAERNLEFPLTIEKGREQRRKFFAQSEECFLDRQGRFILPQEFVDKAAISNEVVLVGCGDYFEIWNKETWERKSQNLSNKL